MSDLIWSVVRAVLIVAGLCAWWALWQRGHEEAGWIFVLMVGLRLGYLTARADRMADRVRRLEEGKR